MLVNLRRDWSTGEGRYREKNNPNEVPDSLRSQLPSDAEVIEAAKPAPKPNKAKKEDK